MSNEVLGDGARPHSFELPLLAGSVLPAWRGAACLAH